MITDAATRIHQYHFNLEAPLSTFSLSLSINLSLL
jgi:hypothetical protein